MNEHVAARQSMAEKRKPLVSTLPPVLTTCGGCRFWAGLTADQQAARGLVKRGPVGECREAPPAVQVGVGPILGYGLTAHDCPACGRGQVRK